MRAASNDADVITAAAPAAAVLCIEVLPELCMSENSEPNQRIWQCRQRYSKTYLKGHPVSVA